MRSSAGGIHQRNRRITATYRIDAIDAIDGTAAAIVSHSPRQRGGLRARRRMRTVWVRASRRKAAARHPAATQTRMEPRRLA